MLDEKYWTARYEDLQTQWDIGHVSDPLKEYVDQLTDKSIKILIPGCGNSYEAEYLFNNGFKNVWLIDISPTPLENFAERCPQFPKEQLINLDFFDLEDEFDLIIEQTFFCSLHPSSRKRYVNKMHELLGLGGKLVGVLFNDSLFQDHPPYGGFIHDYKPLFTSHFELKVFEECHNSIKPRKGREIFINLVKS